MAFLGLLLPIAATGCSGGYDPATATEIPDSVERVVRDAVDHGHRSGIVLGLVNPNGVHNLHVPSDGISLDEHSVFAVGSLTKVFTALLLADMVERGELDLKDPVNRHLPDSLRIPSRAGREMTLLHLATHTSGLPKEPVGWTWEDPDAPARLLEFATSYDYPVGFGSTHEYSNLGMALLARILELRSGHSLAQLFEERLFDPMGLRDTGFDLSAPQRSRVAPPHRGPDLIPVEDLATPEAARGAGGLYSTASDLLRFVELSLAPEASPLSTALASARAPHGPGEEPNLRMGLGLKIYDDGTASVVHHGGQASGHQSFVGFDPENRVGVVLLTSSRADDDLDRVALHLLNPAIPLPDFSIPPEVHLAPDLLQAHSGSYREESGNSIEIEVRDGRLQYTETSPEGKTVRTTTLYARSETDFYFTDLPATVEFRRRDGRTVGMVLRLRGQEFPLERVE